MADRESYDTLVTRALSDIDEILPWDLEALLTDAPDAQDVPDVRGDVPLLIDVREESEFAAGYIPRSINIPRGILEAACDYGFAETNVALVKARERRIVVICRSGRRSALAAITLCELGYGQVQSLKLGVKGWNDSDFPLTTPRGEIVDGEVAEKFLTPAISAEQMG